jgi:hypothetical protein
LAQLLLIPSQGFPKAVTHNDKGVALLLLKAGSDAALFCVWPR